MTRTYLLRIIFKKKLIKHILWLDWLKESSSIWILEPSSCFTKQWSVLMLSTLFQFHHALQSNASGRCLDREVSNVHLTKMRSVSLIRCILKMSPSSSTSTGSQIATWRRSLTWTRHEFSYDLRPPSTGKMFVWPTAFLSEPGSAWYFHTVNHNCLI